MKGRNDMLIIIEGVDGTGKTTLAHQIRDELNQDMPPGPVGKSYVDVRHCGKLQQHPLDEYEGDLDSYRPGFGLHIIYDRHVLGEDVYGPLYREVSSLDPAMRWHIDAYLNSRGAVLVYLTHDASTLMQRNKRKGEDFLQAAHTQIALDKFYQVVSASGIRHKTVLTDPTDQDVNQIILLGQRTEHEVVPLAPFPTYIGPPRPKYLLLGERRGGSDPEKYAAAFVPHRATSGHFMLQSLSGKIAADTGIANACEEDVESLWKTIGKPNVCTLGKAAHEVVTGLGLPHGQVPHPQWTRRFAHSARWRYGDAIAEAVTRQIDMSGWRP